MSYDSYWATFVRILIPNILKPNLIRLTKNCYANCPKIKTAVSPNDMPRSLPRTDIIGVLCTFVCLGHLHNNSHCVYIFSVNVIKSNEVSKCSELMIFKIMANVCQYDTSYLSYESGISLELIAILILGPFA